MYTHILTCASPDTWYIQLCTQLCTHPDVSWCTQCTAVYPDTVLNLVSGYRSRSTLPSKTSTVVYQWTYRAVLHYVLGTSILCIVHTSYGKVANRMPARRALSCGTSFCFFLAIGVKPNIYWKTLYSVFILSKVPSTGVFCQKYRWLGFLALCKKNAIFARAGGGQLIFVVSKAPVNCSQPGYMMRSFIQLYFKSTRVLLRNNEIITVYRSTLDYMY
jgi:hypothetical protein